MHDFIEADVGAGDHQKQKADVQLEAILLEGLDSGEAVPMTKEDWTSLRSQVQERMAARAGESNQLTIKDGR